MFQVYKKFLLFLGVTVLLCITASVVWSKSEVNLVEIKLLDNLDDKRGFCIDIKGHKFKAKIERGLQAHTTGQIHCVIAGPLINIHIVHANDRLTNENLTFFGSSNIDF
jgi:hypothetical protein